MIGIIVNGFFAGATQVHAMGSDFHPAIFSPRGAQIHNHRVLASKTDQMPSKFSGRKFVSYVGSKMCGACSLVFSGVVRIISIAKSTFRFLKL